MRSITKYGLASALCALTTPVCGQDQGQSQSQSKKSDLIQLSITVDGKVVQVDVRGKDMTVTRDGKPFDPARIQKSSKGFFLSDESGLPFAAVQRLPNGASVNRIPRSNKVSIGIESKPLSGALADHLDIKAKDVIYVARVVKGRAAAKAGLRDHDIVVSIDGDAPVDDTRLKAVLKKKKPGDPVELTVLRRGKTKTIDVRCERAPSPEYYYRWSGLPANRAPLDVTWGRLDNGFFQPLTQVAKGNPFGVSGGFADLDEKLPTKQTPPAGKAKLNASPKTKKGKVRPTQPSGAPYVDVFGRYMGALDTLKPGGSVVPYSFVYPRSKGTSLKGVEDRLRQLEERFDRFEEMLQKFVNKKKI